MTIYLKKAKEEATLSCECRDKELMDTLMRICSNDTRCVITVFSFSSECDALGLKVKKTISRQSFFFYFFTPAVESNECKVAPPTGAPSLSDFKPVKPSTDCASVLTMASKLSKLQCFSTCLSAAGSASEA